MRVLFVTQPGEGHFNPLIPLARRLVEDGHTVAFSVAASFCPLVESYGFTAIPAGLDWLESKSREIFPEACELNLRDVGYWFMSELFADSTVHRMVPDLLAVAESWRPDVFVRNDYEFGTCIVSEIIGIPHATLGSSFVWRPDWLKRQLEESLAFARSAFGLPPYPALEMLYPYLYLSYVPARWHPLVLPVLHAIQPEPVTSKTNGRGLDWKQFRSDRPTVYASMGTVNNRLDSQFATILEALRDEPLNLILTVGRNQDPNRWGPQPENVWIERYIPQDELLPLCDLFVTSSSFFTVVAAILHGVPVLMTPLTGDEPTQAYRFAELGFGQILRRPGFAEPPLGDDLPVFGADSLRTMVREMIAEGSHRARVQQARNELAILPPLDQAIQLLDRLAGDKQPIMA